MVRILPSSFIHSFIIASSTYVEEKWLSRINVGSEGKKGDAVIQKGREKRKERQFAKSGSQIETMRAGVEF
jgi:hypothetical protein